MAEKRKNLRRAGAAHLARSLIFALLIQGAIVLAPASLAGAQAANSRPPLPPEAQQGLEQMYGGDLNAAIELFRNLEASRPDNPLGYLLEGEARWWKMYCGTLEVKWGMVDAWKRPKLTSDKEYFALADKAIALARARLKESDSAEMHLYTGFGWALKARLYALRDERRATARAGVKARTEFLRALRLDPNLADADAGLGLYNYYVDTLSGFVKILRFFMGIPGGSKKVGIRQLETAMNQGELTSVEARFYLAKNLRTYDRKYDQALELITPLVERYPDNPIFLLLRGNLYLELGRKESAAADFAAAEKSSSGDPDCAGRVRDVVGALLAAHIH